MPTWHDTSVSFEESGVQNYVSAVEVRLRCAVGRLPPPGRRRTEQRAPWGPTIAVVLVVACGGRESAGGHRSIDDMSGGADASAAPPDTDASSDPAQSLPEGYRIASSGLEPPTSECVTASDCPAIGATGARCEEIVRGYRICIADAAEATQPGTDPSADQCDATRPCEVGTCFETTVYASGQCGFGGASVHNACRSDSCSSDAECPGGFCGPSGLTSDEFTEGGAVRQCFKADCRSDADCTKRVGGVCAWVRDSCAPAQRPITEFRPAQLACVYAGGCVAGSDCRQGRCTVVDGAAVCIESDY
jgi:hypothetical protein